MPGVSGFIVPDLPPEEAAPLGDACQALGLALVATERLPELGYILPLVIGATVVFEIIGPPLTLIQLRKAGETGKGYQEDPDEDD